MPASFLQRLWSWVPVRGFVGPHFYYDVVRLARRGRSTLLRSVYLLVLLAGLAWIYPANTGSDDINTYALVAERFTFTLFLIQNLALLVLAPAYMASAIAEEKERRTLELLFTTQLTNTEIVLGNLTSRMVHLFGFVIAGFPVLSLVQLWGGVDLELIVGNLANTLLNVLTIGSVSIIASVLCRTVTGAVMVSYAIVLPTGLCCAGACTGFPFVLQHDSQAGLGIVTVQYLWVLGPAHMFVSTICLVFAIFQLREKETASDSLTDLGGDLAVGLKGLPGELAAAGLPRPGGKSKTEEQPLDGFLMPYKLPDVTDNALWWKERYLGGPSIFFTPLAAVIGLVISLASVPCLSGIIGENSSEFGIAGLFSFYLLLLGGYTIGVAWRAAVGLAREHQQQTLEPLLLLPIDRREILIAKVYGALWHGWPWLALSAGVVSIGVLTGYLHPFSGVLLCLAPWPVFFFVANLGLLLSLTMKTVLRAVLTMFVILIAVAFFFILPTLMHGDAPFFAALAYSARHEVTLVDVKDIFATLTVLAVCAIGAAACWWLALWRLEHRAS
ncbi:MAG: ABC transporter permease subunit [Planctomycetes bacterium]|nr:ABC transporter permease subunit [Planctomycetota bacterium]